MQHALITAAALTAQCCVLALRFPEQPTGDKPIGLERDTLYNYGDVQYYSIISIGGQQLHGLPDTGSFELVVFDKACIDCGTASRYSRVASKSFKAGPLARSLSYGSGTVQVEQAFDGVAIGPYREVNMSFWDATSAEMPVLLRSVFHAIVGIGPPETPAADVWADVRRLVNMVQEDLEDGPFYPLESTIKSIRRRAELGAALGSQPTPVKADGIASFSICLGKKPGSNGYLTWNDTSFLHHPDHFTHLNVIGRHTWTVNMTNVKLRRGRSFGVFGCEDSCGAIVDSGTSLILMPYSAIDRLQDLITNNDLDCDNMSSLPDLTFTLDGKAFTLPPDAYIAKMTGSWTRQASVRDPTGSTSAYSMRSLRVGSGKCELAVMGSGQTTSWGPLWILGMPFFRKYYTGFVVGRSRNERSLYTSVATSDCRPSLPTALNRLYGEDDAYTHKELRTLNRSDIFISRAAHQVMTQESFRP